MNKLYTSHGSSWLSHPWVCRSACRIFWQPEDRNNYLGFRLVEETSMSKIYAVRGGSWDSDPKKIYTVDRFRLYPNNRNLTLGFRAIEDREP